MLMALEIAGVRVVVAVVLILIVGINLLPSELAASLVKEHGPVEMVTAAGFLGTACWLILRSFKEEKGETFPAGIVVLLLGLRELDFHARFTTMGVFKTRYYISPDVPVMEKTIVSVIVICLLFVVGRFLYRNTKPFISSLKAGDSGAVVLALAIGSGILGKTLDSLSSPLRKVVGIFHDDPRTCLRVVEETIEMAIPLFICLSIYHYFSVKK